MLGFTTLVSILIRIRYVPLPLRKVSYNILIQMNDRYTSANSATAISTTPSSPVRPISFTGLAQPGSNPALYNSAPVAAVSRPGRAQIPRMKTNSESTLSIPPSTLPMPQLLQLLRANVPSEDHGMTYTGQSLRVHMKMAVSEAADTRTG